jgi:hypothetical protein
MLNDLNMETFITKPTEGHIDLLIEVIKKNEHLVNNELNRSTGKMAYDFTSKVVISESIDFLEAIRKDISGEIINNKSIGSFLYFG